MKNEKYYYIRIMFYMIILCNMIFPASQMLYAHQLIFNNQVVDEKFFITSYINCKNQNIAPKRGEYETKEEYAKRISESNFDCKNFLNAKNVVYEAPVILKYDVDKEFFNFPWPINSVGFFNNYEEIKANPINRQIPFLVGSYSSAPPIKDPEVNVFGISLDGNETAAAIIKKFRLPNNIFPSAIGATANDFDKTLFNANWWMTNSPDLRPNLVLSIKKPNSFQIDTYSNKYFDGILVNIVYAMAYSDKRKFASDGVIRLYDFSINMKSSVNKARMLKASEKNLIWRYNGDFPAEVKKSSDFTSILFHYKIKSINLFSKELNENILVISLE